MRRSAGPPSVRCLIVAGDPKRVTMSEFASGALSEGAGTRDGDAGPEIVTLTDARALEVGLTGSKAAALARAAVAGIDTLAGVVLTTAFTAAVDARGEARDHPAVRRCFELAEGDRRPLVARELVGPGGHRRVVDGRSVRLHHRHRHLRSLRGRRPVGPRLPRASGRARVSDRGAGPTADRTSLRRGALRCRPCDRANRSEDRVGGGRWAGAPRQR